MPEQDSYGPPTDELRIGAGLPPAPPRRRRRPLMVAVIALWVAVALAAAASGAYVLLRPEKPITVSGTLTLADTDPTLSRFSWGIEGKPRLWCTGDGGFADITAGASVVIRDGEGKTIAVGRLGDGMTIVGKDEVLGEVSKACDFPFIVERVPARDFYSIEVTHRGPVTYPRAQLARGGVQIKLGS